jgi:DNA-binding transcriptional ArsR family regulator
MPAEVDSDRATDVTVAIAPLMELESAICGVCGTRGKRWEGLVDQIRADPVLTERTAEFWGDGQEWLELFLLLDRAGLALSADPEDVIGRLPELASKRFDVPGLPSEDSGAREMVQDRIDRLAGSPALREKYAAILHDLWAVARPTWEQGGRATAQAMARRIEARLATGETPLDVLPSRHLARNDAYRGLLESGSPIVITPLGLSSKVKYILQAEGGAVYVGFGSEAERPDEDKRKRREEAAAAFKVLSDPTRLGILEYFLGHPASVSDLARTFDVSQPTISAHVKALRQAGLLHSQPRGTHTLYRADRQAVRDFIEKHAAGLLDRAGW